MTEETLKKIKEARRAISLIENAAKLEHQATLSLRDALIAISKDSESATDVLISALEAQAITSRRMLNASRLITSYAENLAK